MPTALIVEDEALPECLQVTARSDQGEVPAIAVPL